MAKTLIEFSVDQQEQKNVPWTNGRTFFDLGRVPGNFLDHVWYLFFVSLFTSHYSIKHLRPPSAIQTNLSTQVYLPKQVYPWILAAAKS